MVQVVQCPFISRIQHLAVDVDIHVLDMLFNIRGPKLLARVEMHQGRMLRNVVGDIFQDSPSIIDVSLSVLFDRLVSLPTKRPAPKIVPFVFVFTVPSRCRILPQVVKAAYTKPAACLAVQEIWTAVYPSAIASSSFGASFTGIEHSRDQPYCKGYNEEQR